ncbi:MAG: hypothetical protein QM519_01440 [Bacteroidia bacterium]|nr:hypothetical protein [Bacteroidia bacterium]
MSFWDRFESSRDGVEDTIEFTIRMAVTTLACVILVVVVAMVVGLFMPKEVVDSDKVFEIIGPAFNTVVGAFVGLLGGLSLNANARDPKPEEPLELTEPAPEPEPAPVAPTPVVAPVVADDDDDDDDMAPWEKYRNDLRYDANGDGVVDEDDFPDWRNPAA